VASRLALLAACLAFWLVLSDQRTVVHLALGVAAAAGVALATSDHRLPGAALRAAPRLALYVPWLLVEIARANIDVMRIVLHPRLPIDPVVIRLEPGLRDDLALATFGNSITLTPGTVTLDIDRGTVVVHALTREGAASLESGEMARRVAAALEPRRG